MYEVEQYEYEDGGQRFEGFWAVYTPDGFIDALFAHAADAEDYASDVNHNIGLDS